MSIGFYPARENAEGSDEVRQYFPLSCTGDNIKKRCTTCFLSNIPAVLPKIPDFIVRVITGKIKRFYEIILANFPIITLRKRAICPQ